MAFGARWFRSDRDKEMAGGKGPVRDRRPRQFSSLPAPRRAVRAENNPALRWWRRSRRSTWLRSGMTQSDGAHGLLHVHGLDGAHPLSFAVFFSDFSLDAKR